jgi:hypothetical protein
MLDFLYRDAPPGKPRDAPARDYVPDWSYWLKMPALRMVHVRVGSEIAHLSYDRMKLTDEAKRWPFLTIRNDFARVMLAFVDNVPENSSAPS